MVSPLAYNAEVERKRASQPPERSDSSDTRRRKRQAPSPTLFHREQRRDEQKDAVGKTTKFSKGARAAASIAPGFRRKRKTLKLAKSLSRKARLFPIAASYTIAFSFWWAVQFAFALMSAVTAYYVDETILGGATNFFIPLDWLVWFLNVIVAAIGIIAVSIGFFSILAAMTNPFRGPIFILAMVATFFYIACIGWPLLAIFPMLFIWLWLAAVFA